MPRKCCQALDTGLGYSDCFAEFHTPTIHPHTKHDMQGHIGLKYGFVIPTQANGVFSLVGRVANPDTVAYAAFFNESMFV